MPDWSDPSVVPLERLIRWWEGIDPPPADYEGYELGFLDEVAFGLRGHSPIGIAILRRSLDGADRNRRFAALEFLSHPGYADATVKAAQLAAFDDGESRVRNLALRGFISLGHFPLTWKQIADVLRGDDQLLAGWAMVYLSRFRPDRSVEILGKALLSPNPRKRELACDEIGDHQIVQLREQMRPLLVDPDDYVAQSARSNLKFFD